MLNQKNLRYLGVLEIPVMLIGLYAGVLDA